MNVWILACDCKCLRKPGALDLELELETVEGFRHGSLQKSYSPGLKLAYRQIIENELGFSGVGEEKSALNMSGSFLCEGWRRTA